MRPSWPDRLAPRAARRKARLLFVVLTVTGLAVCYGLSRSAPPDMCVFADYPAAVALGATAGDGDGRAAAGAAASPAGPGAHAAVHAATTIADATIPDATIAEPGVPAPGDHDGGVLQVCAALLAVLLMLAIGAGGSRDRRFLYELPRPLGPPHVRSRSPRGRAAPSLATLQILQV